MARLPGCGLLGALRQHSLARSDSTPSGGTRFSWIIVVVLVAAAAAYAAVVLSSCPAKSYWSKAHILGMFRERSK